MIIYWSLFFCIVLIQLVPIAIDNGNEARLIISFLLIFVYAAIRGDFANDYFAYERYFNDVHKYSFATMSKDKIELGYLWLNLIIPSYRLLLVLLSAFTCITYYWLFLNFIPSKYYWLGFVLMALSGGNMLFFQLTGLRNAIAINIMTFSIPLIRNRKIIQYAGLMVFAFFFHNSVLFFMPLAYIFASPRRIKASTIVIFSLATIVLLTMSTSSLINNIAPFISQYIDKYLFYIEKVSYSTHKLSILMYIFLFLSIPLSFIVLMKESLSENDTIIIKLSILFLVSFMFGVMNFRMSQYFAPYIVVGTIVVIKRVKNPILKYAYLGAIISFLIYSFILFVGDQYFSFSEYHTFFD